MNTFRGLPHRPPGRVTAWPGIGLKAQFLSVQGCLASGLVSIADKPYSIGQHFTGWQITRRLEAILTHIIVDGVLTCTIRSPSAPPNAPASKVPAPRPAPLLD